MSCSLDGEPTNVLVKLVYELVALLGYWWTTERRRYVKGEARY